MPDKVLFVDDEMNVLSAFRRHLRHDYEVETATSGAEALELCETKGPFAVVVADMNMPGMDGVSLLSEIKQKYPDTIRIMLTGNATQKVAIDAVNEGSIFRFLTKPCPPEILQQVLEAGTRQYQLVTAEKELLEKTLSGSIRMLTDMLSLTNPLAFSLSARLRLIVQHVVKELKLENPWQFELAAMLSQVGTVMIPQEIIVKKMKGAQLSNEDERQFEQHPLIARKFLERIPRLELVARMVGAQQVALQRFHPDHNQGEEYVVAIGAHILFASIVFDSHLTMGLSTKDIVHTMRANPAEFMPSVLKALSTIEYQNKKRLSVDKLQEGMILAEDVCLANGEKVLPNGLQLSYPILLQMYKLNEKPGTLKEPILVILP
ncbi:MAG: two-component system response regulator [Chloroflexi bacterium HGW-Chloroflexi-10]|nr:MAG: two-component system response regulator [Chloroflexi bacterium HGW-Chloroflexi-10]